MSNSREASPMASGRNRGAEMRDIISLFCEHLEMDPEWMTEVLIKENITTPRKWSRLDYSDCSELLHMNSGVNESIIGDVLKGRDWLVQWKQNNADIKWSAMKLKDWESELSDDEMDTWSEVWDDPRKVDNKWKEAKEKWLLDCKMSSQRSHQSPPKRGGKKSNVESNSVASKSNDSQKQDGN